MPAQFRSEALVVAQRERECASCGGRFSAESPKARYCSSRCRTRAYRAAPPAPAHVEGAQIRAFPRPAEMVMSGLYQSTLRKLEEADRVDSPDGQAALSLARIVDEPGGNTASAIAAAVREHRASMVAALEGVVREADPVAARMGEMHVLRGSA